MRQTFLFAVAATTGALVAACGGKGPFALTAVDNNAAALERIVGGLDAPTVGPLNKLGAPLAAVVGERKLSLVNLESASIIWSHSAEVTSRVVIGHDVVIAAEGSALVARDLESGQVRWRYSVSGELVGHAADATSVIVTSKNGNRWSLTALSASSGSERWSENSGGVLGAPETARGVVFVPFLNQWLSILDASSGKSLTRVRALEAKVSFVLREGAEVFFGSDAGVYLFDLRAAGGSAAQSTFGRAKVASPFDKLHYARDGYDTKQAAYTALDQRQILWSAAASGEKLVFDRGVVVAHTYRFLFGLYADTGALAWAYNHPKVDLMAAASLGQAVVGLSKAGEIVVVDSATGAGLAVSMVADLGTVVGASFDAASWRPSGKETPVDTVAALAAITIDRDARFASIKKFAVTALAKQTTPEATAALIEIARSGKGAQEDLAAKALIKRADPSGVPALVAEIEKGRCLALCSRSLAAIELASIPSPLAGRAESALLSHFSDPATIDPDLAAIAQALGRVGGAKTIGAFRQFFLVHRADSSLAENAELAAAITDALAAAGKMARAAVVFAASDPVTADAVATSARRALAK